MKLYVKESEDVTYERNQATDFMTSVLDIIKDIAGILPKHVEYKEYPDVCSKMFDDYIEQKKNFCSISTKYYRKLLI